MDETEDADLEARLMQTLIGSIAVEFFKDRKKIVEALAKYTAVFLGYDKKLAKYHKGDAKKIDEITAFSQNFYLNRGMSLLRPAAEAVKKGSEDYNYLLAAQGVAMLEIAKKRYEKFLVKQGLAFSDL